ncbi:RNA polymerase sigma factor (sigma-70 family) [Lutibacter sp. Hel_I_33_5]|uniref:RNA polymerase sigma factor n=1 Tax=Lutibacter sp. Hel_I_33_5 TaxID=1566289 RepID=UPI00119F43F1|nr:sigma-70 family RNA polymerase sigma factor [Lutibacter sp. Hel_I_33_5]TVZ56287.1 RNA polymerase sigma factor (sigma-70 family) [Lutibacter sp. Hel_I_33_5]
MNKNQRILLLKQADRNALKELYTENRDAFIEFGYKFSKNKEDILDVYQDAIIVLQEQALEGKMDNLTCTVKTYLFSIGKYMLYDKNRKNNKSVTSDFLEKEDYNYKEIAADFTDDTSNENIKKLQIAFGKIGKKCKEVLSLFYYRGYSIDEIATSLNYENKNVVKSQKSRCLKQLRELSNKE